MMLVAKVSFGSLSQNPDAYSHFLTCIARLGGGWVGYM